MRTRVRSAAIRAYCAILGESSVAAVEPMLASDAAAFVSGQVLAVDGGLTAW
mgnify:CR=1 FL=1